MHFDIFSQKKLVRLPYYLLVIIFANCYTLPSAVFVTVSYCIWNQDFEAPELHNARGSKMHFKNRLFENVWVLGCSMKQTLKTI